MEGIKNSDSKDKLNESTLPLLEVGDEGLEKGEGGETPEKEVIELTSTASTEKDDTSEKKDSEKDDEKKEKAKRKTPKCNANCVQKLTVGLNMLDRDDHHINDVINISFEDVLGEPDNSQGIDAIWRLSFVLFSFTKRWLYRLLACLLAIPFALIWGVVFSLITTLHIWIITPSLKLLDVVANVCRKIWRLFIDTFIEPCFYACGACFARMPRSTREQCV